MLFKSILAMVICAAVLILFAAAGVDLGTFGNLSISVLSAIAALAMTGSFRD